MRTMGSAIPVLPMSVEQAYAYPTHHPDKFDLWTNYDKITAISNTAFLTTHFHPQIEQKGVLLR
jgi:hypothetical protein